MRSGGRLPCGFSQVAVAGTRRIAASAVATASSPRSCACEPPAWNAIVKAWPVVCITAWASSKRALVEPDEDLGAHRGPRLGAGVAPGGDRGDHRGQQGVSVGDGIGHPELDPVRRALLAGPGRRGRLVDGERLAAVRLERRRARACRVGRVVAGILGERGPVRTVPDRGDRGVEARPVALDEVGCHDPDGTPSHRPRRAAKGPPQPSPRPFSSTICRSCVIPVAKPASLIAR